jgi:hypothetical protein
MNGYNSLVWRVAIIAGTHTIPRHPYLQRRPIPYHFGYFLHRTSANLQMIGYWGGRRSPLGKMSEVDAITPSNVGKDHEP